MTDASLLRLIDPFAVTGVGVWASEWRVDSLAADLSTLKDGYIGTLSIVATSAIVLSSSSSISVLPALTCGDEYLQVQALPPCVAFAGLALIQPLYLAAPLFLSLLLSVCVSYSLFTSHWLPHSACISQCHLWSILQHLLSPF